MNLRLESVSEMGAALRSGRVSAGELLHRSLAAIARHNTTLGAFVAVDAEGAREAALRADSQLAAGTDLGPLHGVPVAVKDIIDVAGLPTTMGSAHFSEHVADEDAECVRRLREAGAVIVGKTTTHEFAYGPTGDRCLQGPSRNPHAPDRMSGGSSGGSAAAVASGMVPLALGTDTGGSVRIPAALCGVAGFKPAHGAVPMRGVFPLASSLDHVGVLAATPGDCLLGYRALTPDPPPASPPAPGSGLRIGWLLPAAHQPVAGPVLDLTRRSLRGHEVTGTHLPGVEDPRAAFAAIQDSEVYAVHADRVADSPELFDGEVLERLRAAAGTPGWRYVRARAARERARARLGALFDRFDLLASPTVGITAPRLGEREVRVDGVSVPVRDALLALTSPWNLVGFPAISVPAGSVGGLPVGLQLACPPGREPTLFAAAETIGEGTLDG